MAGHFNRRSPRINGTHKYLPYIYTFLKCFPCYIIRARIYKNALKTKKNAFLRKEKENDFFVINQCVQ